MALSINRDDISCPFCECTVTKGSKNEKDLRTLLKIKLNVPIECAMNGKGCNWQGDITQFWEHVSLCDYFPRPCPLECDPNVFMPKKILKVHLQKKCPLRRMQCEYKWAGCDVALSRSEMNIHMQEAAVLHTQLLAKVAKSYRHTINTLKEEIKDLKNTNKSGDDLDASITSPTMTMDLKRENVDGDDENLIPNAKKFKVDSIEMPISSSTETENIWNNGDNYVNVDDFSSEDERELQISTAASGDEDSNSSRFLMIEDSINVHKKTKEIKPLNSAIVRYFYDVRLMGKSCPSQICRYAKADRRTLMIMCEKCEQWYHTMCVKIPNHRARNLSHYTCPSCKVDSVVDE